MKRLPIVVLIVGSLFAVSVGYAVADEPLHVQPFRAKIFAKPSVASDVLGSVDSGFTFVATGRVGNWVKLEYMGKPGYIPSVQVAKNPPLGKSTLQDTGTAPKLNIRSRTSSSSAVVAGMKGLTYEDRARVTKGERSDYEALDKVNALKISPEELRSFQQEGGK